MRYREKKETISETEKKELQYILLQKNTTSSNKTTLPMDKSKSKLKFKRMCYCPYAFS